MDQNPPQEQASAPYYPYLKPYEPPFVTRLKPAEVFVRQKVKRIPMRGVGTNPDTVRKEPLDRWEVVDPLGVKSVHRTHHEACMAASLAQAYWNKARADTLPDTDSPAFRMALSTSAIQIGSGPEDLQAIRQWIRGRVYHPHAVLYGEWFIPFIVQALADRDEIEKHIANVFKNVGESTPPTQP